MKQRFLDHVDLVPALLTYVGIMAGLIALAK